MRARTRRPARNPSAPTPLAHSEICNLQFAICNSLLSPLRTMDCGTWTVDGGLFPSALCSNRPRRLPNPRSASMSRRSPFHTAPRDAPRGREARASFLPPQALTPWPALFQANGLTHASPGQRSAATAALGNRPPGNIPSAESANQGALGRVRRGIGSPGGVTAVTP